MNNFDFISPHYDRLARLVFGKEIKLSQTVQFDILKKDDRILIPGGGTGWILTELDKLGINLVVDYIEKSNSMINQAKSHKPFSHIKVNFYNNNILTTPLSSYNVIITNFFLDVFDSDTFNQVFEYLGKHLHKNGKWINTEFRSTNSIYKNLFIRLMYLFFRITTNLEAGQLPNYDKKFSADGFVKSNSKFFYHQLIVSCIYSRSLSSAQLH